MNEHSLIIYSSWTVIIPCVIGLISFRKYSVFSKMVFALAILGCATELLAKNTFLTNNLPILNTYMVLEYLLIAWIYFKLFKYKDPQLLILLISIIFIVFALGSLIFINGIYVMNSITMLVKSVIITALAIFSFQQILKEDKINVLQNPVFYFSIGMLIYFVGNLFTFGYGQKYFENPLLFSFNIWNIHAVFNIILNLSLAFSLWYGRMKITT